MRSLHGHDYGIVCIIATAKHSITAVFAAHTYVAVMSGLVVINNVNAVARIYFV